MKKTEKNEQAPRRRKSGGGIKRVVSDMHPKS